MIGRRAVIGLSLLSALLFCAFAAQSASATINGGKESTRTTAFTCLASGGETNKDFTDEHCDKKVTAGTGSFEHLKIATGTETKIGGNNEKVTGATNEIESAVLRGTIGITKTEITCKKYVVDETKSFILNAQPKALEHKVTGTVRAEFSECEVKKPAKCTIRDPIIAEAIFVGVEGLKGPKVGEENAMGLRFTGEGEAEGKKETFARILYKGAECALKEKEFPVTGKVIATSGPTTAETGQESQHSGATLVFTPKFEMEELHIGVPANVAEFETIATSKMASAGNPLTLTTTP